METELANAPDLALDAPKRLRASVMTVVLFLAIGLVLVVVAPRQQKVATLADGTRIEMVGTLFGDAEFSSDSSFERRMRRILPAPFISWLPEPWSLPGMSSNTLTVFIRVKSKLPINDGFRMPGRIVLEDANGLEWKTQGPVVGTDSLSSTEQILRYEFKAYPRRQSHFEIRWLGVINKMTATLRVNQRVGGPFPEWIAEPLPARQTNGPLSVTFNGLMRSIKDDENQVIAKWEGRSDHAGWARASEKWTSYGDPTGNRSDEPPPGEPVCRMELTLAREHVADFSPGELMSFPEIPIPTNRTVVEIDKIATNAGVVLKLHVLSPPGSVKMGNRHKPEFTSKQAEDDSTPLRISAWGLPSEENTFRCAKPFLILETIGLSEEDDLIYYICDEMGREIGASHVAGVGKGGGRYLHLYKLSLNESATKLNMVFCVSKRLSYHFLVQNPAVAPAISEGRR